MSESILTALENWLTEYIKEAGDAEADQPRYTARAFKNVLRKIQELRPLKWTPCPENREPCTECKGRGWHVGDCHPQESCGACAGTGYAHPELAIGDLRQELEHLRTQAKQRTELPSRVFSWVRATFGETNAIPRERTLRFLEEAIELAQAEGIESDLIIKLLGHVYAKPTGTREQELGGIGVTLLAYCGSTGLSLDDSTEAELARVLEKNPEHFRERHNIKARAGVATTVATDDTRHQAPFPRNMGGIKVP